MNNHLGYDKYCHTDSDNVRNGKNVKNLVTNNGVVEIEVPRDRSSTFEPALIPKRQRRIEGFDDKIISLYAKVGLWTKTPVFSQNRKFYTKLVL